MNYSEIFYFNMTEAELMLYITKVCEIVVRKVSYDSRLFRRLDDIVDADLEGNESWRSSILPAFIKDKLYYQVVNETDEFYHSKLRRVMSYLNILDVLPTFCAIEDEAQCAAIWTKRSYRRCGLANRFIEKLHLTKEVERKLPGSEDFWNVSRTRSGARY